VLEHGRRRRTPRFDIAWRPNELAHPRLGVVVPRYRQTAVARNRLRRRVREIARRQLLRELPPLDFVIRPRPMAYSASPAVLAEDLVQWRESLQQ